ncbi:hypothetical protein BDQ17DRAFT_1414491 [Cyathus striatus]|nr:hypothetical protein BDQ17DRAFT_1414491 [Cyathus striatus]
MDQIKQKHRFYSSMGDTRAHGARRIGYRTFLGRRESGDVVSLSGCVSCLVITFPNKRTRSLLCWWDIQPEGLAQYTNWLKIDPTVLLRMILSGNAYTALNTPRHGEDTIPEDSCDRRIRRVLYGLYHDVAVREHPACHPAPHIIAGTKRTRCHMVMGCVAVRRWAGHHLCMICSGGWGGERIVGGWVFTIKATSNIQKLSGLCNLCEIEVYR